ncbi:MAG: PadR family transcriptional regulator [Meiothermus sp.]|nr:PadR family transcriptional regulator [Meiothermus sp.]
MAKRSTTDWAVLACLGEGAAHGFRLAGVFGGRQDLGFIWRIARPQVYRALEYLSADRLIAAVRQEEGEAGPSRTVFALTQAGRAELEHWLQAPVWHLRDGRSELLLKLAFLRRRGLPTRGLLVAQLEIFADAERRYRAQLDGAEGLERIALEWRLSVATAAVAFVRGQLEDAN